MARAVLASIMENSLRKSRPSPWQTLSFRSRGPAYYQRSPTERSRAEERTGGRNGQGQEVEEARGNQVCHLLKAKRRAVGLNLAPFCFDPQGILNLEHGAEGEALVGEASAAASGAEVAAGRAERG